MRFENVTFVDGAIKAMAKKKFIKLHMNAIWQDRTEEERKKMLSDVYDRITGKKKPVK